MAEVKDWIMAASTNVTNLGKHNRLASSINSTQLLAVTPGEQVSLFKKMKFREIEKPKKKIGEKKFREIKIITGI